MLRFSQLKKMNIIVILKRFLIIKIRVTEIYLYYEFILITKFAYNAINNFSIFLS